MNSGQVMRQLQAKYIPQESEIQSFPPFFSSRRLFLLFFFFLKILLICKPANYNSSRLNNCAVGAIIDEWFGLREQVVSFSLPITHIVLGN